MMKYYLSFDVGTSGVKASLVSIEYPERKSVDVLASVKMDYSLLIGENGVMEQDAEEIFVKIAMSSRQLITKTGINVKDISAICFCGCLIGSVAVDREGKPVCRAFSFLDSRGASILKEEAKKGITFYGLSPAKLLRAFHVTLLAPVSPKDFIWRIKWLEKNNPEAQKKLYKWLNYKEYFLLRSTGRFVMTRDTAYSTALFDSRPGKDCFDKFLCRQYGISPDVFPEIVGATDIVGPLTGKAAAEMGLCPGIPVVAGGADTSVVPIGTGVVNDNDVNIYVGTCGWVSTVTKRRKMDGKVYMGTIVGVQPDSRICYGQMETAGKALSWARKLIFNDELAGSFMMQKAAAAPAGSNGVLFVPWLAGSRAPFSDNDIGGMFYNMHADTDKATLARSAIEGVCLQLRWLYESQLKMLSTKAACIRLCGGCASEDFFAQTLADVLGVEIQVPSLPGESGVVGLSCLSAIATGQLPGFSAIKELVKAEKVFKPDADNHKIYNKCYSVFTEIYRANKKLLNTLNKDGSQK